VVLPFLLVAFAIVYLRMGETGVVVLFAVIPVGYVALERRLTRA
jgi:hypothetical protein